MFGLTDELIKEELSYCYLNSVAAIMGIAVEQFRRDGDSTDCTLMRMIDLDSSSRINVHLRVQLKCTCSIQETPNHIIYDLKAKNYNDLSDKSTCPIILCLLILPGTKDQWINCTPEDLVINGRMYWETFEGCSHTNNSSSKRIQIDKQNTINPQSLYNIMDKIAKEEQI